MNKEEMIKALKQFGREDLLKGPYGVQDTDTSIEVFMSVKDMVKYDKLQQEKEELKQALIDIRELVKKDSVEIDGKYTEVCCSGDSILQIIDKVLDLDKVRGE